MFCSDSIHLGESRKQRGGTRSADGDPDPDRLWRQHPSEPQSVCPYPGLDSSFRVREMAKLLMAALNAHGGDASMLSLPSVGVFGNTCSPLGGNRSGWCGQIPSEETNDAGRKGLRAVPQNSEAKRVGGTRALRGARHPAQQLHQAMQAAGVGADAGGAVPARCSKAVVSRPLLPARAAQPARIARRAPPHQLGHNSGYRRAACPTDTPERSRSMAYRPARSSCHSSRRWRR
jgi:hypothetical protein